MIVPKYKTIPVGTAVQDISGRKGVVIFYLEANRHLVKVKWEDGDEELAGVSDLELPK